MSTMSTTVMVCLSVAAPPTVVPRAVPRDDPNGLAKLRAEIELRGPSAKIYAVIFSPNGNHLASGDAHGLVKNWDFEKRNVVHSVTGSSIRLLRSTS